MVPRARSQAAAVDVPRRRFTIDEYHRMGEVGVLTEDDRVELLGGEIVQMSPIGSPHAGCVARLTELFGRRLRSRAIVWEPQPDVSLLVPRRDLYARAHPRPRDVLLAVEVVDANRGYDRTLKLPPYARAELREVWLVDLAANAVEVSTRPALRGYREQRRFGRGQVIVPLAFPRLRVRVGEILG